MKNIVKQNKQFLLAFFGVLFIMLSCSIFVSNSNMDPGSVTIQSITPVYDEEATYSVGNTGVIFNDKEQVVKYNVVVQNNENYDVKVTDLKLGTKSQEFLKYEVENVELDEVIKPGETKELVVSFETVKMDGWGRNFNDEIVTTLVFDRVLINPEPSVPNNNQNNEVPKVETVPDNSGNVVVQPEVNEPVIEQPKEEVNNDVVTPEEDINHELGMNQEIIVKDSNTGDLFVIFCFGAAVGVLGIGLVMVNKNKFTKYIVLFVIVGSSVRLASANEAFSLEIPINVSYESQNVMKPSGCGYNDYDVDIDGCDDYWGYAHSIVNYYIQNEITEFEEYAYQFDVSEKQNGRVIATMLVNEEDSSTYDLYLQADGIIYANENANFYFAGLSNVDKINNLYGIDTSKVIDAEYMFLGFGTSLESIELNLNSMDVSNIRNMNNMFLSAGYDASNFTLDVSEWNTSNVTDMSEMFYDSGFYASNFTLDVSGFDTSNVTNMYRMFSNTGYNASNFTLDVRSFDTSNVTDMSEMFYRTGYNSSNFTLDVSNFDTSNVTNMRAMFDGTGYSNPNFILDLSNFDTSNVKNISNMFSRTGYSNPNFTLDLSNFDTSNVTNMFGMFSETGYSNPNFTLDLSNFDTSNVTDMRRMFYGTGFNNPNFTLDLSNFDTSNVTDMSEMFYKTGYNSSDFTLDLSSFDTSKVTDMDSMFRETGYNVSNFTLDVSNFDTSNVTDMSKMFYGTGYNSSNFTLDLSNFDTSNVTDMDSMFRETGYNSSNFTLDISNFDTTEVFVTCFMFSYTGHNSTNFNTSITIKNPYFTPNGYRSMFDGVATQPGSKIIVNYTSETEALVDKMIATKSANSNVVKGENIEIGYLKLFPLNNNGDSEIFNFIIGMTWSEWINSEYNTKGLTISGNKILYQGKYTVTQETESGSKRVVSPNDLITPGYPCYYQQASLA